MMITKGDTLDRTRRKTYFVFESSFYYLLNMMTQEMYFDIDYPIDVDECPF